MNSRVSWNASKQFTETSDYVNLGPVRNFPSTSTFQNAKIDFAPQSSWKISDQSQNTPYSRPIASIKPKMPAQNFFAPTSSLFREDSENDLSRTTVGVKPPLYTGLSKPRIEPDLNITRSPDPNQLELNLKNYHHRAHPGQEEHLVVQEASTATSRGSSKKQRRKPDKPAPQDFKRILIGSVEHVTRWHKLARSAELSFLYEAIGTLDNWSVKGCATLIFLRGDLGQIIQGLFYSVDYMLPPLKTGTAISMIGKMIGSHKMMVMNVTEIQPDEKPAVKRLAFLCQRALNAAAGNPPAMNL